MGNEMKIKVGVYVCHCGGNISDVVKVNEVAEELKKHPNVSYATNYVFMCSDPGQNLIIEDLKNNKVDRVVVAACSPALHELTFRKALIRAGINPYFFEHVNIREQDSWVHKYTPDEATQKAIKLVTAGVEKVSCAKALTAIGVETEKVVAVIGAGFSGMQAALALARAKLSVVLIEKDKSMGGKLNEFPTIYPESTSTTQLISQLSSDISQQKNITTYLNTEITNLDGYVGNFKITLNNTETIKVGALVFATGHQHYPISRGEYSFQENPKVITMPQFKKAFQKGLDSNIKNIAFIHCVGSRQVEGVHRCQPDGKLNEYCSRVCCTTIMYTINEVLDKYPNLQIYDCYRDIRTYGRGHEDLYEKASKRGVIFFRFTEHNPPRIENNKVLVTDVLTWNEEIEIPVDLVVLATGIMPNDISELSKKIKLPKGPDRFLQEAHPKLRPVEIANMGIYLAGTCQAPMDTVEAKNGARGAACKAITLLGQEKIFLDPFVAEVEQSKCDGCQLCLKECSYSGALFINQQNKAEVNSALCKGCGACVAVCPPRALDIAGWRLAQLEAMVDAIVGDKT